MAMTGPAFVASWALAIGAMKRPSELPLLRLDHATARSLTDNCASVGDFDYTSPS
jgi:hypothetical protein